MYTYERGCIMLTNVSSDCNAPENVKYMSEIKKAFFFEFIKSEISVFLTPLWVSLETPKW